MTTLIKFIIATVLSLSLFSCNFDINLNSGVKGNGEVTEENRVINSSFTTIKATDGLDVYVTQSDNESISVEADGNLQELILTEINGGVLKIHTKEHIGSATSKKVHVSFKDILKITSTSGSDVQSTNRITTKRLEIKSTSGSDLELNINTTELHCKSSSGSSIRLSGETEKLIAEATSGSDIKATDLISESTEAKASSGADIKINTSKSLIARATSGGDIKYYGNPEKLDIRDSASGSIKQK